MRVMLSIIGILTAVGFLYKWRYRLFNVILSVGFLRKMAVTLMMRGTGRRRQMMTRL